MKKEHRVPKRRYFGNGTVKRLTFICLGGIAAGFCNGLLGAGGGIVAVLALSAVLPKDGESRRSLYANALCIMLPLSLLTLSVYAVKKSVPSDFLSGVYVWVLLGGAVGGLLGGVALDKLKSNFTDKLFAILTVISGILMLVK